MWRVRVGVGWVGVVGGGKVGSVWLAAFRQVGVRVGRVVGGPPVPICSTPAVGWARGVQWQSRPATSTAKETLSGTRTIRCSILPPQFIHRSHHDHNHPTSGECWNSLQNAVSYQRCNATGYV